MCRFPCTFFFYEELYYEDIRNNVRVFVSCMGFHEKQSEVSILLTIPVNYLGSLECYYSKNLKC